MDDEVAAAEAEYAADRVYHMIRNGDIDDYLDKVIQAVKDRRRDIGYVERRKGRPPKAKS